MKSEYKTPHPDPPRCQFLYPEYQSAPLDVSTSNRSPSHLPYIPVLVPRVQDTSPSGQY